MRARPMELRPDAFIVHQKKRVKLIIAAGLHQGLGWEDLLLQATKADLDFKGMPDYVRAETLRGR